MLYVDTYQMCIIQPCGALQVFLFNFSPTKTSKIRGVILGYLLYYQTFVRR